MWPTRSVSRARALAVLGLAMLTIAACGDDDSERPGRSKGEPIKLTIGSSVPLSGRLREFGPDARRAATLAIERISEAIKQSGADDDVDLVTVDNGSNPQRAIETARQLVADGAECIVGPWGGVEALSVARSVAVPERVALISPAASLDELTDLTDSTLISRTAPPDSAQGLALARAIADDLGTANGKTVNVGARDDAYGEGLASSFIDAWRRAGGKVGAWVTYDVDREAPGAIAKKLAADGAEATVIFDFPASFTRLAPALAATPGYESSSTWAADLLASTELPGEVPDDAIEGMRGTLPAAPRGAPGTEAFFELFTADGSDSEPRPFAAQTFDGVILCYLAAVAAGSADGAELGPLVAPVSAPGGEELNWEQLPRAIRALRKGEEIDHQGASGPIDMNVHGDPTAATYDIYEFSGPDVLLVDQVSIGSDSSGG